MDEDYSFMYDNSRCRRILKVSKSVLNNNIKKGKALLENFGYNIVAERIDDTGKKKIFRCKIIQSDQNKNITGSNQASALKEFDQASIIVPEIKKEGSEKLIQEVFDYLQQKTGEVFDKADYGYLVKKYISDGYHINDFISVIDHKMATWHDQLNMRIYIRPQTLFGSKFKGYLAEAKQYKKININANGSESPTSNNTQSAIPRKGINYLLLDAQQDEELRKAREHFIDPPAEE